MLIYFIGFQAFLMCDILLDCHSSFCIRFLLLNPESHDTLRTRSFPASRQECVKSNTWTCTPIQHHCSASSIVPTPRIIAVQCTFISRRMQNPAERSIFSNGINAALEHGACLLHLLTLGAMIFLNVPRHICSLSSFCFTRQGRSGSSKIRTESIMRSKASCLLSVLIRSCMDLAFRSCSPCVS